MCKIRHKFLITAALLTAASSLHAGKFSLTSPLIQIGDDTDILFDSYASFNLTDNLYSSVDKVSAFSINVTPGFTLEYAKDSPVYITATAQRSKVSYLGGTTLSRLDNSQDHFDGTVYIDEGGPLKFTLQSSYNESARNDNLTSLGIDQTSIGETLVRQGSYTHLVKAEYRLTEKINARLTFTNSYNRYLNPTKIATFDETTSPYVLKELNYNTNSLSEMNSKTIQLNFNYQAPGDLITYGFNFQHDINDFSPAPYYSEDKIANTVDTHRGTTSKFPFTIYQSLKDFYGLTASGKLTRSGKLGLDTKIGFSTSTTKDYLAGESILSGLSYEISLKHNLTELINHELNLIRSTAPTPNGTDSRTSTYGYTLNYAATDNLSLNLHLTRSDISVGSTDINTTDYSMGAMYSYNDHLRFTATVDLLDTAFPNNPENGFQSKSFILNATFRY